MGAQTIAAALPQMAAQQPDAVALWLPSSLKAKPPVRYTPVTFRELNTQCERTMRALHHVGVRQGVHVAVMVKPGLEFFSLTFALFQLGALPVLIDPGIGLKALKSCLAEAQPEVFIGIPPAHLARVVLGWGKGSVRTTISVGPSGFWAQHRLDQLIRKTAEHDLPEVTIKPEDRAAILFTSGSTGIPKGVIYEHRNFAAQVRMIRDLYTIEPGEVDLPTFPLFALFSPALGTTSVIPPMDFTRPAKVDPAVLVDAIDQHGVNTMFGSPALLNTLSRWCARRTHRLDGFKRVISAGAPVPAAVLQRMRDALPDGADIVTPYGATETLPIASIESREVLGETAASSQLGRGVCVGRVADDVELWIAEVSDEVITTEEALNSALAEPGAIGEVCVASPAVTTGYFGRERATALAKIARSDGSVIHRMGDLGWVDEQRRLWFCGRKSQRVRLASGDRFTVAVEGVFNAHPGVHRSALVGIGDAGAQRAVLFVEPERELSEPMGEQQLRAELLELARQHDQTRCVETVLFHEPFPVDIRHNAKIGRERLAQLAAKELA